MYDITVFGTYWYVPVCTEYILVRNAENGTYQYVPFLWQYILVCTGMYCLVPAQYKVVQDGTWWYRKVHGSTMNGIWRYMEVQGRTRIV